MHPAVTPTSTLRYSLHATIPGVVSLHNISLKICVSQEGESASQPASQPAASLMVTMETRKLVQSLALLICFEEVTSSNCSRNTYYSDGGFSWFYIVRLRKCGIIPSLDIDLFLLNFSDFIICQSFFNSTPYMLIH